MLLLSSNLHLLQILQDGTLPPLIPHGSKPSMRRDHHPPNHPRRLLMNYGVLQHHTTGLVPITAETPRREWQPDPNYRQGYVPAKLAEGHYGGRYGPGIHSVRAGLALLNSGSPSAKRGVSLR